MTVDVFWLTLNDNTPARGYWDNGMLEDYFAGTMWRPAGYPKFKHHEVRELPVAKKGVVIIASRHHAQQIDKINAELKKLDRVILFLTGDEESEFAVEDIKHPNIEIWVMSPRFDRHAKYHWLGTGYPTHLNAIAPTIEYGKTVDVFFSGQITHSRREEMWAKLEEYSKQNKNVDIHGTKGFTQGFKPAEYIKRMARARVAPAPSGPITPDSFRLFEALECMAIPIADEQDPNGTFTSYWAEFFDEQPPFPLIKDYTSLIGYITDMLEDWEMRVAKQTAWWIKQKRKLAYKITNQIKE